MTDRILTRAELNRATLARQMLLARSERPVLDAIEHLAGLQGQQPQSPYIGLWTRLRDFEREALAGPIHARAVVKATLQRATLHLVTARDYPWLRATLEPVLERSLAAIAKQRRATGLDFERVLAAGRAFLAEEPRPFAALSDMLGELMPDADVGAMRYAVRMKLPLVQVPTRNGWSYPGNPLFTLAEQWLGQPIEAAPDLRALVFRYLAAFGPASLADLQTWSGLTGLKAAIAPFRDELVTFRDESGRELLDLPDQPLPPADTPAPVRFLPEYDNLLLAYKDRTRVIADEYRWRVFLPGLRVRSCVLVDGFVRAGWGLEKTKAGAVLLIEPFEPLAPDQRDAIAAEGERLARFIIGSAGAVVVQFVD